MEKKVAAREIFGLIMSGQCASERRKFLKRSTMQPPHNFGLIKTGWNNGEIRQLSGSRMLEVSVAF